MHTTSYHSWAVLGIVLRSVEPGVCVFNQAASAKLFHCPITINGDGAVLNVELLQLPAVIGNALNSLVTHHLAALDAEFFQVGTMFCQDGQARIGYITLSHVQGPES